jgi:hypothetical protein
MSDVGNLLKGYNVQLESKALGTFGAAVGDYAKQAGMGPLADIASSSINNKGLTIKTVGGLASAFGVQGIDGALGMKHAWQSSTYASDLVNFAPKHRFIFKVKFIFNEPYSNSINREFMYVVKEIDKPTVHFEYEDVNMYNFKTKVLKSIKHEALNMVFHDDIQNKVLDFFNSYRLAYSPISSLNYNQKAIFEQAGMDFYAPGSGGASSASMGLLAGGNRNVLSHIEVTQVYAHGTRQNVFIFTNPKIESFDFDNLSMESSEGNSLAVSFAYDALYIYDDITNGTPSPAWGKSDILGNREVGSRNQFGNQLIGGDSVGKRASSIFGGVSDALGNPISAITSAFGEAAGNIKKEINGIISSATSEVESLAKSTLAAARSGIDQAKAGLAGLGTFGAKDLVTDHSDVALDDYMANDRDLANGNATVVDYSNDALDLTKQAGDPTPVDLIV